LRVSTSICLDMSIMYITRVGLNNEKWRKKDQRHCYMINPQTFLNKLFGSCFQYEISTLENQVRITSSLAFCFLFAICQRTWIVYLRVILVNEIFIPTKITDLVFPKLLIILVELGLSKIVGGIHLSDVKQSKPSKLITHMSVQLPSLILLE
jgi:hypothetical protein